VVDLPAKSPIEVSLLGDTPKTIFISHSHLDKDRAVEVKEVLRTIGFAGFVAHEDIEPTLEWSDEILRNLREAAGLLVLATPAARDSAWVNQEIGAMAVRGRGVVSLNLGCAPFGLLYRYQALRWKLPPSQGQFDVRAAAESNVPGLYRALEKVDVARKDHLVEGIGASQSFEEARVTSAMLGKMGDLDPLQALRLVYLIAHNSNVSRCWDARRVLPPLLSPHLESFPPELVDALDAAGFAIGPPDEPPALGPAPTV
jgi:hypothetical protein